LLNIRLYGLSLLAMLLIAPTAGAQQTIGTVQMQDATVEGALRVTNGRAILEGASTITARDHTATVTLQQGGTVRVCSTSGLHLTAGKTIGGNAPLLIALDRGAIEVATQSNPGDVLMTPDLRFTMKQPGLLDLRIRVARNGDTCVENRGESAPVLSVADQFGEASYELRAGQHVLFERGSLKEVVDHESEPCGCPAEPAISVADAGVTSSNAARPGNGVAKTASEQHPFPAAISAGLSPESALPPTPQGQVHAQVSTTMSYGTTASGTATGSDGAPLPASSTSGAKAAVASSPAQAAPATPDAATASVGRAEAPPPPPAPSAGNVFHSIGHFFKRLFGGH
jgi:hypothetical protein